MQLPNIWLSAGASKVPTLGSFPKPYMSKHGLPPEYLSELVVVAIVATLKESGNHKILENIAFFQRGLISVDLTPLRQREEYLREKLDKISDLKHEGLINFIAFSAWCSRGVPPDEEDHLQKCFEDG